MPFNFEQSMEELSELTMKEQEDKRKGVTY